MKTRELQERCRPAHPQAPEENAFVRWEIMPLLMALALLAVVASPVFAQSKTRSLSAVCAGNLRLIAQAIGQAHAEYGTDSWRPSPTYPGPALSGLQANVWIHFMVLSNAVPNPRVFACPSDVQVRPALDYSLSPNGGFLHPTRQNNAVSYTLGLDSSALRPDSVLAADRNLRHDGTTSPCSSGVNPALQIRTQVDAPTGWRPGLHGPSGNLLFRDGRVESTSNESVNRWFRGSDDSGSLHLLAPRF